MNAAQNDAHRGDYIGDYIDDRVPVTVTLSPTQAVLLELVLASLVEKYGAVDENRVTDHIFARGLDAYGDALLTHAPKDCAHALTT